uniref:C-type lectin domain-containing protein n=1 Tax=Salarias fasciatus TaxID=181472 RepID=A0A672GAD5_SALFA
TQGCVFFIIYSGFFISQGTLSFFFASIFCAAVEGEVGTHYYVSKAMNWNDAQNYCRKYYTDLSSVNSQEDTEKILNAAGRVESLPWLLKGAWIGLYRDPTNATRWKWSGGGYVTYTNWAIGQPDNYFNQENRGLIYIILLTLRSDVSLHSSSKFVVFTVFLFNLSKVCF